MSITIPTTELVGGLTDVLPIITDEKSSLAGVELRWDGDALHFTTYDVLSAATVKWVPGEGAEGDVEAGPEGEEMPDDDIAWGGDDDPWRVWIWLPQAKEILKLFKLPAKLWRYPVAVGVDVTQARLVIEREDGPRVGRLLTLPTSNDTLRHIPDVRQIADRPADALIGLMAEEEMATRVHPAMSYAHYRLAAFGQARFHGTLTMTFGQAREYTAVHMGTRYAGFIYPADAKGVRPFNLLRDGAGVHTSESLADGAGVPDDEPF